MHRTALIAIFIATTLATSGCAKVKVDAEAETTRAITAEEAESCKRLGKTNVKVLAKILFVKRNEKKVGRDTEAMARNEAVRMGGNAVAPESDIKEGRQTFGIYACGGSSEPAAMP